MVKKTQKNIILESGFSRVRSMMMGVVPSVNSIGIMTAENPDAMATPPKRNKQLNKQLINILRQMNYGPIPIQGSFGQKENSFLIPNISKKEIIKLGQEFSQEAVIWASKEQRDGSPLMNWEYIDQSGNTLQTRDVSLSGTDVQSRDDYYSQKKGRKFIIPFFDPEYEPAKKVKDSSIPPTQDDVDGLKNERASALHETIKKRAGYLTEGNRTDKSKWHHRGLMELELLQLKEYFNKSK